MTIYLPPPSVEELQTFMVAVEEIRSSIPRNEWEEFCRKDVSMAEWRHFLCDDPYTRHGLLKPRGYPGDARLMDYAYRHQSIHPNITRATEAGRQIYEVTYGAAQSRSARDRTKLVSDVMKRMLDQNEQIRVASFASGHAREIEELGSDANRVCEFIAIDSDKRSLDEIASSYKQYVNISSVNRSVFRFRPQEIGHVDIAYSMGLFDYLNQDAAIRIVQMMGETVTAGGNLLIGNLAEGAANLGYCESMMDWWMIPRTEDEMENLASVLRSKGWQANVIQMGCFRYLLGTAPT